MIWANPYIAAIMGYEGAYEGTSGTEPDWLHAGR